MKMYKILQILFAMVAVIQPASAQDAFSIGWASTDITPSGPVAMGGMPYARISTGIMDPLTATALALQAPDREAVIMISCDLRNISDILRDRVRDLLKASLPGVRSESIILNATHTHNAPPLDNYGIDFKAMGEDEFIAFAAPRIAAVAERAWKEKKPGGISFGLTHAVVGHNRLITNFNGKSRMAGKTNAPEFSHVEGYEDHSVNVMYTWNLTKKLTGMIVNVSVPSQVSLSESRLSADYWHDTRLELRRQLGGDLFVLPQCGAAGDQFPGVLVDKNAESRMERLTGRTRRQTIAVRIADATASLIPVMEKNIDWQPLLSQRMELVPLSRRRISEKDVDSLLAEAGEAKAVYEKGLREIEAKPEIKEQPLLYKPISSAYRKVKKGKIAEERFKIQQTQPFFPAEVHILRIGGMAIATNPFELYVDYGIQIKARSLAEQTFLVQLAGNGSYVPTVRSIAGGGYGAIPSSTLVGSEGGRELVNWTVEAINAMWANELPPAHR